MPPSPFDPAALWLKSKLFLNRAMDDDSGRTFDEQAMWASQALELLAKAALARHNPLLVADPTDGQNLLIASGLVQGEALFKSVNAATLYRRCEQAFKPFSADEAIKIGNNRNSYLHGSGVGFLGIPQATWWARFWAQAAVLVTALDQDLDGLVGSDRVPIVEAHLERNKRNIEQRAQSLVERARQRMSMLSTGTLPASVHAEMTRQGSLDAGLPHRTPASCPACGASGSLEGEHVDDVDVEYDQVAEDDFEVHVTLTVSPDYFSCSTCGLVLDGFELLAQFDLEDTFTVEGDPHDVEGTVGEYGNE